MWCHYCDKNNHNTADRRAIPKFKQQKKVFFEPIYITKKKVLDNLFLVEEINSLKRQMKLKPEWTASSRKKKAKSLLYSL
jgi:hypothetical protein